MFFMKSKKKIIALALAMLLLLTAFVAATFAYFTDSEFAKNNVITIGNVEIDLYEHSEAYTTTPDDDTLEDNDDIYQDYLDSKDNLLPGETVGKYTYIKNTGTNEAYVRFVVTVPGEIDSFLAYQWNDAYTVTRVPGAQATDPVVYYVVRDAALAVGALSEPGLETVSLKPELSEKDVAGFTQVFADGTRDFGITVAAHAIQTVGFDDAADAFDMFDDNGANVQNEKVQP